MSTVVFPGSAFATQIEAIAALVQVYSDGGQIEWVSFVGAAGSQKHRIQLAGNQINFCNETLDLSGALKAADLKELSERVTPTGGRRPDMTLWSLASPTPQDIAVTIDAAFTHGFGLGPAYTLRGDLGG